jgi:hypothetical protein
MKDAIINWIIHQVVDKKRLTAALIAGVNLVRDPLAKIGVEIPDSLVFELGSFGAILVLALWSKMNARKAEIPKET